MKQNRRTHLNQVIKGNSDISVTIAHRLNLKVLRVQKGDIIDYGKIKQLVTNVIKDEGRTSIYSIARVGIEILPIKAVYCKNMLTELKISHVHPYEDKNYSSIDKLLRKDGL